MPTHIYVFKMPKVNDFTDIRPFLEEKFDASNPIRTVLNFKVGSATEYSKLIFKSTITVCGAETIAPTDGQGLVDLKTRFGTNKYWVTKDGWFNTMFDLINNGAGQSE